MVSAVAKIIGKPWSREKTGLRADVSLGVFPNDINAAIAKLEAEGYEVIRP